MPIYIYYIHMHVAISRMRFCKMAGGQRGPQLTPERPSCLLLLFALLLLQLQL